jgi:hypothetical protein
MRRVFALMLALSVCASPWTVRAQSKYTGPWDPAADAAAEEAVARLGSTRGLDLRGVVVIIPALLRR